MSPPRRSSERRYAHIGRAAASPPPFIATLPEGPELPPPTVALPPASPSTDVAGAVNLAPAPSAGASSSLLANATASAAPTPDTSTTAHVPTDPKTVISATVALLSFFVLCLVAYQVYLYRKKQKRAARNARGLQPPMIVVETYQAHSFSTKRCPDWDEPASPASPFKTCALPTSPRDDTKSRAHTAPGTPILVKFPTMATSEQEKAPVIVLPSMPTAAAKPTPLRRDTHWRPSTRDSDSDSTQRLSTRSSSLLAARFSAAPAQRLPSITVTDLSNPLPPNVSLDAPPLPTNGLPKLVTVIATFARSLPDELEVHLGETLHVLETYADEWCLAERIGRGKRQRGVVPQFCVQDKAALVPRKRFSFVPFAAS